MNSISVSRTRNSTMSTATRVLLAVTIITVALVGATFAGEQAERLLGLSARARHLLQAVITSSVVLPAIWWLRSRFEGRELASVGLQFSGRTLGGVVVGVGIVAVPVLLIITTSRLFNWATIAIDTSPAALWALAVGVVTVFLLEAVPEEVVVRGYIYRTLSGTQARWKASVLSVLLFLAIPIVIVGIQHYLLRQEIQINGASRIEPNYLIIMLIFGSFQQYLRVLSGTIWIGVGFHGAFVLINRIMGPRPSQMIRFEDVTASGPLQLVSIGSVVLILGTILAWPWLARRSLGWRQVDPE